MIEKAKILKELSALPPEAQKLVADFITFLSRQYKSPKSPRRKRLPPLASEKAFGMWKDRADMQDSVAYVRSLRQEQWRQNR